MSETYTFLTGLSDSEDIPNLCNMKWHNETDLVNDQFVYCCTGNVFARCTLMIELQLYIGDNVQELLKIMKGL